MDMNAEWIERTFLELVQISSHSLEEGRMAQRCQKELAELGFSITFDQAGEQLGGETGNLIATLPGDSSLPKVLLAAHMDTVQPGRGVSPRVDAGVVHSDGSTVLGADDKAGVTAILSAVRYIVQNRVPHGQIQVVLTIAEEIGLQGARHLDMSLIHSDVGLSLDSGGAIGTIPVAGPTQVKWEATFVGKSAHAGVAPERGISAIRVAARAVAQMPHGRIDEETTVNIGSFVGESPTNVVAERARLLGEIRSRNDEKLEKIIHQMQQVFEATAAENAARVEFRHQKMYDGFRYGSDSPARQRIEAAMQRLGHQPVPVEVGGGSDANILSAAGLPILNIGIGYEEIHSTSEMIRLEDIVEAAKIATTFCTLEAGEKLSSDGQ
ncbi:MAG: M20/M25/M40 family metallo-hydrolase [Alicyclobacillaceae bacterium]|nr:M20/M25/M40 family metallo-hydrolase [Alicyclobacillaceae bacterium]